MSEGVAPGDVGRLSETALASAGEYVALAALASRPNGDPAWLQLSGSCGDPNAFTWWWALCKRDSSRLMYAAKLPERVQVNGELLDEVCAHIVTPELQQQRQRQTAESFSRAELLKRLDPHESKVLDAARVVVSASNQHTVEVLDAALSTLGASTNAGDRGRVLEHAAALPYVGRPTVYMKLAAPVTDGEAEQITAGLSEMKARGADAETWKLGATALTRQLPLNFIADFLATPFTHGTGRTPLLGAGLVRMLGPERLEQLLEHLDSPDVAEELLPHAATFSDGDLVAFAEWAHARYSSDACAPLRAKIAQGLDRRWNREEARQRAQEGLWRCALAANDAEGVSDDLISTLSGTDLPARAAQVTSGSEARQLGAVTARFLAATSEEDAITSACSAVDALPSERRPSFFAGYMAAANDPQTGLVTALLDVALSADDTASMALANGSTAQLVQRASQFPEHSARVLILGTDVLDANQAAALLGAPPAATPPVGRGQSTESAVGGGVSWTDVSSSTYLRVIAAAERWSEALFGVVDRAVASLDEPEARQPPPAVLAAVLEAAERADLRDQLGESTNPHIERLLRQSEPSILGAACRWVSRLDSQGFADIERAQMVIDADDRRAHRHAELSALRDDLAAHHAARAANTALDVDARVQHLRLAARLNPKTGRDAACSLTAGRTVEVRRAAAEVIAQTPGSVEDHDLLVERLQVEDDAHARDALQTALHRLTSSSLDEAIRNLLGMLELTTVSVDALVVVPDPSHHERFIEWSDRARARSTNSEDPGAFIEAALNVAHQMVDLAVVGRFDATGGPLKVEQAEAIRQNNARRLDEGLLVTRQDLVQTFPWFSTVAALREKRGAHSSKLGSLEPVRYRPDDLISARDMLRTIARGWLSDMQRSHDLRATPST